METRGLRRSGGPNRGVRQGRFFVNIEPAANPLLMRKAGNLSLSNMPTNW